LRIEARKSVASQASTGKFMRIFLVIALLFAPLLAQAETLRIASWDIEQFVADTDRGPHSFFDTTVKRAAQRAQFDLLIRKDVDILEILPIRMATLRQFLTA